MDTDTRFRQEDVGGGPKEKNLRLGTIEGAMFRGLSSEDVQVQDRNYSAGENRQAYEEKHRPHANHQGEIHEHELPYCYQNYCLGLI